MNGTRTIVLAWLLLVAATVATTLAGEFGHGGPSVALLLAAVTLFKGERVARVFMGLKGTAGPWRWAVLGWLAVVVAVVGVAYRLAMG
jgi:hypothetical protein